MIKERPRRIEDLVKMNFIINNISEFEEFNKI